MRLNFSIIPVGIFFKANLRSLTGLYVLRLNMSTFVKNINSTNNKRFNAYFLGC
jgi:hypothetical protein